ncbi:MAG TPA: septum formation initiator family protein [Ferruginibacter sp.]|nr:septum formation initiator family protein [Ferruginibacter sp.]HMP19472.1 septum formation initiator family protein [Ferruginibacter sp.]
MEQNSENTAAPKLRTNGGLGRLGFLKNKYLLAGSFFLVWMLFFDPKDIGTVMSKKSKYNALKESELQLSKQISETKQELGQLKNSAQTIEKYAREKYLMKKDNEDLFIVPDEKAANNQ